MLSSIFLVTEDVCLIVLRYYITIMQNVSYLRAKHNRIIREAAQTLPKSHQLVRSLQDTEGVMAIFQHHSSVKSNTNPAFGK